MKFLNAISREKKPLAPLKLQATRDFFGTKARRFQAVVAGCLRTSPLERYQKPSEVVEDLERVLAGKAPIHLKDPLDRVLREAYQGGYGGGPLRKIVMGVFLVLVILGSGYALLNEVPSLREYLPEAVRSVLPWYR